MIRFKLKKDKADRFEIGSNTEFLTQTELD